jgi:hypothetical protein
MGTSDGVRQGPIEIFGSSRISLQPSGTGRRIATKSAVVLSQARGNGVYEKFSGDTFPAVPAQEPAVTSPAARP